MDQIATWFKHLARVVGGIWFDRQEIHHAFFAEIVGVAIVTD
ncbi:hypothetical protein RU88_GL000439 [Lactococcus raffinolactis]|nr:hypothetical protein RU88_GL000439 [Lactococcus raffinolactis]